MAITQLGTVASINNAANTSQSVAVGLNCAAGTLVELRIAAISATATGTLSSVTDSQGNTYTKVSSFFYSTRNVEVAIFASVLTTGLTSGTDTITVSLSANKAMIGLCQSWSGVSLTTDGSGGRGAFANKGWTAVSPGFTTTNANDLILVMGSDGTGTSSNLDTPSSGYTDDDNGTVHTKGTVIAQHQIVSATGTFTGGGTLASSDNIGACIVALEAASGSSAVDLGSPSATCTTAATALVTAATFPTPPPQGTCTTAAAVPMTAPALLSPSAACVTASAATLTAAAQITPSAVCTTAASVSLSAPALLSPSAVCVASATAGTTAAALLSPSATCVTGATCAVSAPGAQFLTPSAAALTAATASLTAASFLTPQAVAATGATASVTVSGGSALLQRTVIGIGL